MISVGKTFSSKKANNKTKIGEMGMVFDDRHWMVGVWWAFI